jgi:hypothetical protein
MKYRTILLMFSALAAPASAQSVNDVLAANRAASGGDAWSGKTAMTETYSYVGQGLTGTTVTTFDLSNGRFVDSYDLGPAKGAQGFDGAHAWAKDTSGTVTSQDGGSTLPLSFNEAYRDANLWWRADRGGAAIAIDTAKSDANDDVLSVTPKNGQNFEAWFDRKSHLLVRLFEQQGAAPTTSTLSDYRSIGGAMIAGKIVQSTGNAKYDQTQALLSATFLPAQEDAFFAQPKVAIHDASIANGAHEAVLPFKLINNHIFAYVKIDGKGPYLFIFDTGGVNVVTPPLAKSLGLKVEGKMEARGAGSGTMETGLTKVDKVELGDATVMAQTFAAFPLDALSDVEGFDQSGMIGFETFRRFVTRIDYGAHTITLIDPKYFDAKDAGVAVPLKFDGNVAEIDATYDGIAGVFQLDTGARTSLTLTSAFVAKHELRAHEGKGVEAATGWGVGGVTRSYVERTGTLSIANIDIKGAVVQLSTDTGGAMAESDLAGNIGAGILKRFVLTLDYEHNVVYVKPAAGPIADLDTFDRAGLWINRDVKGFKIVDITAHAPAEEAGLKAGDIVTAVDGKPATSLEVYDLRLRLRNDAPGTKVSLTIERAGETSTHIITLRDLI